MALLTPKRSSLRANSLAHCLTITNSSLDLTIITWAAETRKNLTGTFSLVAAHSVYVVRDNLLGNYVLCDDWRAVYKSGITDMDEKNHCIFEEPEDPLAYVDVSAH